MPDGGLPGGLSFSEIGQGAKKAGQNVISPILKQVQSQITGKPVQPAGSSTPAKNFGFGANDITSNIKSQTTGIISGQQTQEDIKTQQRQQQIGKGNEPKSGVFDIAGLTKAPQQQSAQPPNEYASVQQKASSSQNDFLNDFNEKDPFGSMQKKVVPQQQAMQPSKDDIKRQEEINKQQAEDRQKYQALLNKLHQMQTEPVLKAGETDDKEKQEEEKRKKQEEEQEKERKEEEKEQQLQQNVAPQGKKKHGFMGYKKVKKAMGDMLGAIVKKRQGAKEGGGGAGKG